MLTETFDKKAKLEYLIKSLDKDDNFKRACLIRLKDVSSKVFDRLKERVVLDKIVKAVIQTRPDVIIFTDKVNHLEIKTFADENKNAELTEKTRRAYMIEFKKQSGGILFTLTPEKLFKEIQETVKQTGPDAIINAEHRTIRELKIQSVVLAALSEAAEKPVVKNEPAPAV